MGKKWYLSKTLWVNTIAVVGIIVQGQTGIDYLDPETQVAILGVINLILRVVTSEKITM
jgi:hypothetical protein